MEGLESMCALTRAFRRLTGVIETGISCGLLGLEGSRPLRPFKLAVLTTVKIYIGYTHHTTIWSHISLIIQCNRYHFKGALGMWIKQKSARHYLPSPSLRPGTFDNGNTGIDFAVFYPHDSFCLPDKRIWRFSALCAIKKQHMHVAY